jgi:hypothetical protein
MKEELERTRYLTAEKKERVQCLLIPQGLLLPPMSMSDTCDLGIRVPGKEEERIRQPEQGEKQGLRDDLGELAVSGLAAALLDLCLPAESRLGDRWRIPPSLIIYDVCRYTSPFCKGSLG